MNREVVLGLAIIGGIAGGIGIVATAAGSPLPDSVYLMLAFWLAVIIVVRVYVYERFGNRVGDWVIVILIFGPVTLLVAPILWWEHHRSDGDESGSTAAG